jgi:Holliday junction resolvase-like predicted endonuclease
MMQDPEDRLDAQGQDILKAKDEVLARYGRVFSPQNIKNMSAEDFLSFLSFKNNHHWEGLHRRGPDIVKDIKKLRSALAVLVDEARPIVQRMDRVLDGPDRVPYLGRAVLTAILMVVYPDRYAVWNTKSEAGMRELEVLPANDGTRGEQYARMNEVALAASRALNVDLWTLDMLWWRVIGLGTDEAELQPETSITPAVSRFALEAHLHEFLEENWEQIELGKDWDLLEEDGEVIGSHYKTGEVGEIDLLARHKKKPRWLVVELKRDQTGDATVGQVLRYRAWVKKRLAKTGEEVEGLILCRDVDAKLRYAISELPLIRCMTYEVSFTLQPMRMESGAT